MKSGDQLKLASVSAQREGCAVCCAAQVTDPHVTIAQMNDLIPWLIGQNIVKSDCFIMDWEAVLACVAKWLASHGSETITEWGINGYHQTEPRQPPYTYIIRNKKPNYTHFTCVEDGTFFDPLPPNRPAAKTYLLKEYLYLKKL